MGSSYGIPEHGGGSQLSGGQPRPRQVALRLIEARVNAERERAGMAPLEAWTRSLASPSAEVIRARRAVAMPSAEMPRVIQSSAVPARCRSGARWATTNLRTRRHARRVLMLSLSFDDEDAALPRLSMLFRDDEEVLFPMLSETAETTDLLRVRQGFPAAPLRRGP